MADLPTTSAGAGAASPSISNPNLPSPQIASSPSSAFDYASLQQQQGLLSPPSSSLHRSSSGSLPRIAALQHQFGPAAAAAAAAAAGGGNMRMYNSSASQMSFAAPQSRMLPSQFNLLSQQRGKMGQQQQQALQGIQSLGMIGGMGMNTQIRTGANGNLVYNQQRIAGQLRQQQPAGSQQAQLTSPQKLQGQTVPRQLSVSAMNPQLSGLVQNGQSALVQSTLSPQQWMKQIQPTMPNAVSPSYHVQQRQQQAFLQQHLSSSQLHPKSMGLNQQQISQLIQQQPQLATQLQQRQHMSIQQQQQLQPLSIQHQQQQQLSPRMPGSAVQNSINLTGSQPGTPLSGGTAGGSSSQGTSVSNQLLGKRKIHDLVAQVDSACNLDPEVEDFLLEMADHFIDSVTSFACTIAKHRKSTTLEPKDVLLNIEKNWHLTVSGYTRGENKYQKNSVRSVNIQQSERDASTTKGTVRQTFNDPGFDRSIKPSPSSEHLGLSASQMSQKITRF